MNANMDLVPKGKALILVKGAHMDSVFLMQYYSAKSDRLFMVESYKDSILVEMYGLRMLYHPNG